MRNSREQKLLDDFERTTWLIEKQAEGLTHGDSVLQLPFRGNCFNWVVGHILESRHRILEILGEEASWLSPEERARYGRGSEPITTAAKALPFERLLEAVRQSHDRIANALQARPAGYFEEIIDPERQRTRADRLAWFHWHETYHTGQLEILRQLAGTDDAIIR